MGTINNLIVNNDGSTTDIKDFPTIKIDQLSDIFLLNNFDEEYRENTWDTYKFNNIPVPRVSNILKETIAKEYLVNWAAKVGYKNMEYIRNSATFIGSRVHELIEHYLTFNEDLDISYRISPRYMKKIDIAYHNFKAWLENLNKLGYKIEKIYGLEKSISCPYYGGTIDCIAQINGAVYILDWKTSKQISFEYIIQTIAYMWCINHGYVKDIHHIDGIGIVRVDKNKEDTYEDLFLNYHIPYQRDIINQYTNGFGFMLGSYYNNINMRLLFDQYQEKYSLKPVLSVGGKESD